jgi:lipopolysaccharide transport system permease protein
MESESIVEGVRPHVAGASSKTIRLDITPGRTRVVQTLREVWAYRDLLVFLTWRDLKVRYRQTALGASWAILQPLTTMVIFTAVFGAIAKMPSDGMPYPIFTYAALLPWNLFSGAVTRVTASFVGNANLLTKVYVPRVLIPLSGLAASIVDFGFSFAILLVMMVWYHVMPSARILALPLLIMLATAAAFALGLWLAALNVRYRDVTYVIPFLLQVWLYASPVGYSTTSVPVKWRTLYELNPLVGVIEGFRWVLLGTQWTPGWLVLMSVGFVILGVAGAIWYFQGTEDTFADIV